VEKQRQASLHACTAILSLLACALGFPETFAWKELRVAAIDTGSVPSEETAARCLIEDLTERTQIPCRIVSIEETADVLLLTRASATHLANDRHSGWCTPLARHALNVSLPEEGFFVGTVPRLTPEKPPAYLILYGNTGRSLMYAVGWFLRQVDTGPSELTLSATLPYSSAPAYPLRGHQLGYRARANSYDAWTVPQYERYIRDLVWFGANAIENIPFEDQQPSPHMRVSREEMNVALSRLCVQYDLQYWLWSPADFSLAAEDKKTEMLARHAGLFAACPRVDAVFFPGGDPGDNPPELVFPYLERLAHELTSRHPRAKIWLSFQGFTPTWVTEALAYIHDQRPAWLGGVVGGPGSPPLSWLRIVVPQLYPLRDYPDITHTVRCQYPVYWWDPAFALTLGRECINPRPCYYTAVFRATAPYTQGFIAYSDGVHDDVNKCLWLALGWNPEVEPRSVLTEYARCFLATMEPENVADAILALERNWEGDLATNGHVPMTQRAWEELFQRHPHWGKNWRALLCRLRADYDAYVRERLLRESRLEREAEAMLLRAPEVGAEAAMAAAEAQLREADSAAAASPLRVRIEQTCEALFNLIGLQTSVERYRAGGAERGAVLDFVDVPLNNRWWLEDQFAQVRAMPEPRERVARLIEIATWESPAGGWYDDVGHPGKSPHVMRGESWIADPTYRETPNPEHQWWDDGRSRQRRSWMVTMDWPKGLRYEGLRRDCFYVLRVTGFGTILPVVDGKPLKPLGHKLDIGEVGEFAIPWEATHDGRLTVTFQKPHEPGINWRQASRLSEVWLVPAAEANETTSSESQ